MPPKHIPNVESSNLSRDKIVRILDNIEVNTYDLERDAKKEVVECKPSQLFNLIASASSYRILAGCAEEVYPDDLNIKEHVKSSRDLLTNRALELTSKFEKECVCMKK